MNQLHFPLPELDRAIEALIAFRDAFDSHGEPLEDDDPAEHDGTDAGDPAWVEWNTMHGAQKGGTNIAGEHEDDEEDDDDGGNITDDEPAFDRQSRAIANMLAGSGAGCAINGDQELNGDEGDYTYGVEC